MLSLSIPVLVFHNIVKKFDPTCNFLRCITNELFTGMPTVNECDAQVLLTLKRKLNIPVCTVMENMFCVV